MLKFYTNTIENKFIKNLLASTELPNIECVKSGDYLLKDNTYLFNTKLIKCVASGVLDNSAEIVNLGTYHFGDKIPKLTNTFFSNIDYYDPLTHKRLGQYLRTYKAVTNINLMPFYNCFNYTVFNNFHFKNNSIVYSQDSNYKILGIPIKYNRTYTIAIDSDLPIQYKAMIYSTFGFVKENYSNESSPELSTLLDPVQIKTTSFFNDPFLYTLNIEENANKELLYKHQKDLYLVILIPAMNKSSIIVLEGNYVNNLCLNKIYNNEDTSKINLEEILYYNISLLNINKQITYAFSDTLVEYLLDNVITSADEINFDVARILKYMNTEATGVWSNELQSAIYNRCLDYVKSLKTQFNFIDLNGFVNKSVENFLVTSYNKTNKYSKIYENK